MKYSKLKKKLSKLKYVTNLLYTEALKESQLKRDIMFKCDSFFVGSSLAILNQEKYYPKMAKIKRRIKHLTNIRNRLNAN